MIRARAAVGGGTPLVGRAEELALAVGAMRPPHLGVVLSGQAGVGKTRLAREVLASISAEVPVIHRATATRDGASIPFSLFSLLGTGPDGGDQSGVLRAVAAQLRSEADGARLPVLHVDDVQWIDPASAVGLLRLVEQRLLTVVLTLRNGEAVPHSVASLWKDDHVHRIDLAPLGRGETGAMVEHLAGARPDAATLERIWASSHGNPLYIREIVRSALADSRPQSEVWVWRGGITPDRQLTDLVELHLRQADAPTRDVLLLLAVGEQLSQPLVERLVGSDALAEAERLDLVAVDHEHRSVALAHPLFGEVLRDTAPSMDLRQWRTRLADAVLSTLPHPSADDDDPAARAILEREPMRQAFWLLALDDDDLAARDAETDARGPTDGTDGTDGPRTRDRVAACLRLGAAKALLVGDYDIAHRFASRADTVATRANVANLLSLAIAASGRGRPDEADAILVRTRGLGGPPTVQSRLANEHAHILCFGLGRGEAALDAMDEWLAVVTDPDWRAVVEGERAGVLSFLGRFDEAHAASAPLLDHPFPMARLRAFDVWGQIEAFAGRPEVVAERALELAPIALTAPPGWRVARLFTAPAQFVALLTTGRLVEAERLADLMEMVNPFADDELRAIIAGSRGFIELLRGHPQSALDLLTESAALSDASRRSWRSSLVAIARAEALGLMGDGEAARAAQAVARRNPDSQPAIATPYRARADAWVCVANGDLAGAQRRALEGARWCADRGFAGLEFVLRLEAVRMGARGRELSRMEELGSGSCPDLYRTFGDYARGLRTSDGELLDQVGDELARCGFDLFAAESFSLASEAHRRSGDGTLAALSATHASELQDRCGGVTTPVFVSANPGGGASLTRREQEVVALVAAGGTNRAIADTLNLSVRTVEGHVLRAFAKLGVTTRAELGDRLGRTPPAV